MVNKFQKDWTKIKLATYRKMGNGRWNILSFYDDVILVSDSLLLIFGLIANIMRGSPSATI